jgi:acyl-CoA reductase-like NAD-dependent aldehyde dehydrogenase
MSLTSTTTKTSRNGVGVNTNQSSVPLIIEGKDVTTAHSFTVGNPAGGDLWQAYGTSEQDAIRAVEAAQAAFPAWSKTKPAYRRDIFLKAAELFEKRKDELKRFQKEETGAEDTFIDWILPLTIDQLKEVGGKCSSIIGTTPISSEEGRTAIVVKEPYGVILGIAPWFVLPILCLVL